MPFEDSLEMLCDYLGAGRAYMGKNFSYEAEYNWWLKKKENPLAMHTINKCFITNVLKELATTDKEKDILNYKYLKLQYRQFYVGWNMMFKIAKEGEKTNA